MWIKLCQGKDKNGQTGFKKQIQLCFLIATLSDTYKGRQKKGGKYTSGNTKKRELI